MQNAEEWETMREYLKSLLLNRDDTILLVKCVLSVAALYLIIWLMV